MSLQTELKQNYERRTISPVLVRPFATSSLRFLQLLCHMFLLLAFDSQFRSELARNRLVTPCRASPASDTSAATCSPTSWDTNQRLPEDVTLATWQRMWLYARFQSCSGTFHRHALFSALGNNAWRRNTTCQIIGFDLGSLNILRINRSHNFVTLILKLEYAVA
jgi:hypothetical protein